MVLDQQVPLERAFRSPVRPAGAAGRAPRRRRSSPPWIPRPWPPSSASRPALHRFPKSMAGRVQEVCAVIVDAYGGDAAAIWTSAADGKELLANVRALPGFGDQKARIFVALLGKQLGVRPTGWEKAAAPYGEPGVPLGGRHRLPRGPGQGAPVQAEDEGRGQGQGGHVRLTSADGDPGPLGPEPTGGSTCAPPTAPTSGLRRRPASRAASTSCSCGRSIWTTAAWPSGPLWCSGSAPTRGALHPQRPTRPGRGHRRRRGPRRPGRPVAGEARRVVGGRGPRRACRPTPCTSWTPPSGSRPRGRAPLPSTTSRPARCTPTPTKPGRPGTGLGYIGEAVPGPRGRCGSPAGSTPTTVAAMVAAGARHFVVVRWL